MGTLLESKRSAQTWGPSPSLRCSFAWLEACGIVVCCDFARQRKLNILAMYGRCQLHSMQVCAVGLCIVDGPYDVSLIGWQFPTHNPCFILLSPELLSDIRTALETDLCRQTHILVRLSIVKEFQLIRRCRRNQACNRQKWAACSSENGIVSNSFTIFQYPRNLQLPQPPSFLSKIGTPFGNLKHL